MNAMTSVPPEIADTIIATIIYFTATSVLFKKFWDSVAKKLTLRREAKEALVVEDAAERNVALEAADEAYELKVSDAGAKTGAEAGLKTSTKAGSTSVKGKPKPATENAPRLKQKPSAVSKDDGKEVK